LRLSVDEASSQECCRAEDVFAGFHFDFRYDFVFVLRTGGE
jgi:hypothetical protein